LVSHIFGNPAKIIAAWLGFLASSVVLIRLGIITLSLIIIDFCRILSMKRISGGKKFRACLFDGINKKRLFQSKMHKLKKQNGFRKIIIQTDIKLHQMNIKPRYNQED